MKLTLLLVSLCLSLYARTQVSWQDSFSDSSLSVNPTWTGDTALFIHQNGKLQLNDTLARTSQIRTSSPVSSQGHWSGWLALDFNPSSSNYAEIVLCGNQAGSAYILRFGGDSKDRISLLYTLPGLEHVMLQSSEGLLGSSLNEVEWSVSRYADSLWTVEVNLNQMGWQTLGASADSTTFPSDFFAFVCHYTVTRSDKFSFDDVQVTGFPFMDTTAPSILSYEWQNPKTIEFTLSEKGYSDSIYIRDQTGRPWEIWFTADHIFELRSAEPVHNGVYRFDFSPLYDSYSNPMLPFTVTLERTTRHEIAINEIMCDPDPPVAIHYEYVELQNLTSDTLSLNGWSLMIDQSKIELEGDLLPYAYKVVKCTLPNRGGQVVIKDDWGHTMSEVFYQEDLHSTDWKSNGGWSLERHESRPSSDLEYAWTSSNSEQGGTPGEPNQPETGRKKPLNSLSHMEWNSDSITLNFAFQLDSLKWNEIGLKPQHFRGTQWTVPVSQEVNILRAFHSSSFELDTSVIRTPLIIGSNPNVLISEVLFDPEDGLPEFVELINLGSEAILLNQLRISRWSQEYGIEALYEVSSIAQPFLPGEIVVLSTLNGDTLYSHYSSSNRRAHHTSLLPFSLALEDGLCITLPSGKVIDSVIWDKESYPSFLNTTKGLSLIRKNSNDSWETNVQLRATPGIHSSLSFSVTDSPQITNARFSPNQDGYKDEVQIALPKQWNGWVVSLEVFTASGTLITTALSPQVVHPPTLFSWDGMDEGSRLPSGQYLLVLRAENDKGQVEIWRHGCLLID